MNKDQLIRKVAAELNRNNSEVKEVVESLFTIISDELGKGKPAKIVGFGSFEVRDRVERPGRNPQTGEVIKLPKTKTPAFTPSKKLKDLVKGRA